MSNFNKLKKAVDELLEVMSSQKNDVNLLIFKIIFEQYGSKKNITPIQVSKDLLNEFLNNEIDKKYFGQKVVIEEEKVNEEKKLYTNTQEAYNDFFRELVTEGSKNDIELLFYRDISKKIWTPFINSHKLNLPHRYAPQQTKI
jgi:uncharacterized protein YciU (UPF0263 family)